MSDWIFSGKIKQTFFVNPNATGDTMALGFIKGLILFFVICFGLSGKVLASEQTTPMREVSLDPNEYKLISFEKIPPTQFAYEKGVLSMKVEKSSAALIKRFADVQSVQTVSFKWKSSGKRNVADAAIEKEKSGDDFYLRIGLIMSGPAPWVPFFAPAWIKALRDYMTLPTNHMKYLLVGTHHSPGSEWESPYSSSISNLALASTAAPGGYQKAEAKFDLPLEIVGLWIMADGDNSASVFTTELKYLQLQ
jgi:hypothetical protein